MQTPSSSARASNMQTPLSSGGVSKMPKTSAGVSSMQTPYSARGSEVQIGLSETHTASSYATASGSAITAQINVPSTSLDIKCSNQMSGNHGSQTSANHGLESKRVNAESLTLSPVLKLGRSKSNFVDLCKYIISFYHSKVVNNFDFNNDLFTVANNQSHLHVLLTLNLL